MSNKNQLAVTVKNSIVIAKKRRTRKLISPAAFCRLFSGSFEMKIIDNIAFCRFISPGKKAHAWGEDSTKAYRNTLRKFHQKYAA